MPTREKKQQSVEELTDRLARSQIAILTSFNNLSVANMEQARRRLREAGIELRVAKKTLLLRAAEATHKPGLADLLSGSVAVAFGYESQTEPAKVLSDYLRTSRVTNIQILGAVLDGRTLSAADVTTLAELPPREVLLAQVLGGLQSPMTGLVSVLNAALSSLAWVLQARMQQLEQGASPETSS